MTEVSTTELLRHLGVDDPLRVGALSGGLTRWGPNLAGLYAAAAMRRPTQEAVIDDDGALTFGELHRLSTATALGLRDAGLKAGEHLGVLCRNNRQFVVASVAAAKAGLTVVYLNTGFGASQLGDVLEREGVAALVHDEGFGALVDESGHAGLAISDLSSLAVTGWKARTRRPLTPQRLRLPVLLTSGTTGVPKGARHGAKPSTSSTGLLRAIPYSTDDRTLIAAPLFHAWGLGQLMLSATLGTTVIVSEQFDPDATMRLASSTNATTLAVVPVMIQRILDSTAPPAPLKIVATSGSQLPAHVATAWMDRFGDNLYNLYGSTEVGQATIATPTDLRAAPGTAGCVVPGSVVKILDEARTECPAGTVGEIFVGSGLDFRGYTGGGGKEVADGLLSTGDLGRFDAAGRLFIEGRADDMIVSGGENVFPREVEDLIAARDDVVEVAVVGVPDDDFGERLVAFVVARGAIDPAAISRHVATELARHKTPRDVIVIDELPRTTTGKVRRPELIARAAD